MSQHIAVDGNIQRPAEHCAVPGVPCFQKSTKVFKSSCAYQPPLIQTENLGVASNEMFVFLMEIGVMAPARVPTKHCWYLCLLQNNAARLCPLPTPSAGWGIHLHHAFILPLSTKYWRQCFWIGKMRNSTDFVHHTLPVWIVCKHIMAFYKERRDHLWPCNDSPFPRSLHFD